MVFDRVKELEDACLCYIVLTGALNVFDVICRDREPLTPPRDSFLEVGQRADALVKTLEGRARECIHLKQAPGAALMAGLESRSKV